MSAVVASTPQLQQCPRLSAQRQGGKREWREREGERRGEKGREGEREVLTGLAQRTAP